MVKMAVTKNARVNTPVEAIESFSLGVRVVSVLANVETEGEEGGEVGRSSSEVRGELGGDEVKSELLVGTMIVLNL